MGQIKNLNEVTHDGRSIKNLTKRRYSVIFQSVKIPKYMFCR